MLHKNIFTDKGKLFEAVGTNTNIKSGRVNLNKDERKESVKCYSERILKEALEMQTDFDEN